MRVFDWLIFRRGVFPAVKSNPVENAPCDVTREILLNIIHTHQFKIIHKKLRSLFTPSVIFFVTKFHIFCHHVESYQRSIFIISTKPNRSQFSWTVPSYSFVSTELWLWWHKRGASLSATLLLWKEQNYHFFFIWAVIDFLTANISWFLFKGLITVGRELRQQHPSDLSSGAGTSRERSSRDVPAGQQITRFKHNHDEPYRHWHQDGGWHAPSIVTHAIAWRREL